MNPARWGAQGLQLAALLFGPVEAVWRLVPPEPWIPPQPLARAPVEHSVRLSLQFSWAPPAYSGSESMALDSQSEVPARALPVDFAPRPAVMALRQAAGRSGAKQNRAVEKSGWLQRQCPELYQWRMTA
jgi:hypothetical protein